MKNVNRRSKTTLLALLALVAFSSCNRGYGCPTNFSIGDGFQMLLDMFVAIF